MRWFRLAAEQGRASARNRLGFMYSAGRGVSQDDKEAVKWYRLASEQGDDDAQYRLGWMYAKGRGIPKNYMEAYKWTYLSAASGHAKSGEWRDWVATQMSQSQIEEAQKLARECMNKNYKGC